MQQNIQRDWRELYLLRASESADALTVQWGTGPNYHIEHLLMDILNGHKCDQEKFSTLWILNLFAVIFYFTSCSVLPNFRLFLPIVKIILVWVNASVLYLMSEIIAGCLKRLDRFITSMYGRKKTDRFYLSFEEPLNRVRNCHRKSISLLNKVPHIAKLVRYI